MLVLKFGGTSVADAQPITRVAEIVARVRGPRVVVVSALGGVTDRLLQAAACAEAGRVDQALAVVGGVAQRHRQVAAALVGDADRELSAFLDRTGEELEALLRETAVLKNGSLRTRDAIAAAGELMSSRLIAAAFVRLGLPAVAVDPRSVVVTDGHHGEARPLMSETTERLAAAVVPLVQDGAVPVIGGFVGATLEGVTTTLGRGGSDFSAAIVGAALGAREIQIWTDVDGVLAADPRIVDDPQLVPQLTFGEARELAYFGAKVLHPATIEPAVERHIPVRILNSRSPEAPGTLVNGAVLRRRDAPAALACKRGVATMEAAPPAGQRPSTFLRSVFEALEASGVHPCVTTVSDGVVVAAFDDEARARAAAAALGPGARVHVRTDMALLAAVGESLSRVPRLSADVLTAVDGLAVHAVAQPPSGRSLTLLLDDADVEEAMKRVYERFFGAADAAVEGHPQALAAAVHGV